MENQGFSQWGVKISTIPVLNPGNYRVFNLIQDSIITLAHSDEPYMRNYDKFMKTPIPRTKTWVEDAAPQNPLPHLWTAENPADDATC